MHVHIMRWKYFNGYIFILLHFDVLLKTEAIIGSDHGLMPVRRQAIIWTNAVLLSIGTLGTNFCEIPNSNIFIQERAFQNVVWNIILSWPQHINLGSKQITSGNPHNFASQIH